MAEERMLNDEILLGLIKANSGGGGGGTTDYSDLSNKPQINGTTLTGNKSASDLGLVASVDGKGLSTNDYTNEDKAIVGGVTAALAGKQDALTAGDYIEIDGNEISVNPVVPNEEATYQIVSDGQEGGTYFVRINKIVDGEVVLTERYSTVDNVKRTFDDTIRIDYANTVGWNFTYELLVASTTHDAGYTYSWGYSAQVDIDEVVVTADHSGESLVLKAQMDTALSGKQDTLTFDSVPTDGSTNPVESNGVYDALALKQNATDNNLTTTSKTVVGAVNELKSGLTSLGLSVVDGRLCQTYSV